MKVELEPFELEHAVAVGHRRHAANLAKPDAAHYDKSRMEDNLTASIAGAACEMAVAKAFNLYWPGSAWDSSQHEHYRHDPDIPPNIEVKRTRKPDGPLVVRRRDVEANRIVVSAYADYDSNFSTIHINGWMHAPQAWEIGSPAEYDQVNTRLVACADAHPAEGFNP